MRRRTRTQHTHERRIFWSEHGAYSLKLSLAIIADWRRQKVQDHKFDFIDVEDYVDDSAWRKFKYSLVFAIVIKGILIYCADLWYVENKGLRPETIQHNTSL